LKPDVYWVILELEKGGQRELHVGCAPVPTKPNWMKTYGSVDKRHVPGLWRQQAFVSAPILASIVQADMAVFKK
jgi:hypothetical protein